MWSNLSLILGISIPSFLFGQDTIIVVGNNPKYLDIHTGLYGGLYSKLPKGTYCVYRLKNKYKNKISFKDEKIKNKKYRGKLIRISTYGKDSLLTGTSRYYSYNYKTNKVECYGIQHYKNGKLNGFEIEYTMYSSPREIRSIGKYLNGKKHGVWFYFSGNPFTITEIEYNKGTIVDRSPPATLPSSK